MRGELFASVLTTDEMLAVTSDARWIDAMLAVEVALSATLADLDLIPRDAAEAISRAANERVDVAAVARRAREGANPVIPLVDSLRERLPDAFRAFVHHGATSQDVLDTAAQLLARDAVALVRRDVRGAADAAAVLARRYRDTPMLGRTLLQPAPPITFGFKAAGWLEGLLDATAALDRFVPTAQLGGPVGTGAAYGDRAPDVLAAFARRLELAVPTIAWHAARQRVADLGAALAIVTATAAKITTDVALLMQSEVGEAAEPAAEGRGRSSSIPGKRNPVLATEARAAAQTAGPLVTVLIDAVVAEHERAAGAWQAEWGVLNDLLVLAGGAADRVRTVLDGVEVHDAAMAARVDPSLPVGPTAAWIDRVLARHGRRDS